MNDINGKMISRSQQTLSHLINLLRGKVAAPSLYTAQGTKTQYTSSYTVVLPHRADLPTGDGLRLPVRTFMGTREGDGGRSGGHLHCHRSTAQASAAVHSAAASRGRGTRPVLLRSDDHRLHPDLHREQLREVSVDDTVLPTADDYVEVKKRCR
jgi:hypothetical protein